MDDDEEDAFVYIFDRRSSSTGDQRKVHIGGVFSFDGFYQKILNIFNIDRNEELVITTTNRNLIANDDAYVSLIESGDTLYILDFVEQPLKESVSEKIEFQPHYDTLIKSGIYEYYASEGHVNPLPFAFAELVDNALAATVKNKGPRYIELSLHLDCSNGENILCVYDNGEGMTSRQLNNWAIYRLSKFNRVERHKKKKTDNSFFDDSLPSSSLHGQCTPKSLNSDISWFGVGGKQAIFFIGGSTRIITKPHDSCDVHEFSMSKEEFRRKEKNREAIFTGYIRNRKPRDSTHINESDQVTKDFINLEEENSFTRVIVGGIDSNHLPFMKESCKIWTRQLAHIYHYYIHGPEGNTMMSKSRKNIGALDVTIKVTLHEKGKQIFSIDLSEVDDDLESKYIRTAADSFEFRSKSDSGKGVIEGMIRYHPFLYDKETYPLDHSNDDEDSNYDGEPPGRGRRPIFECFWNGRLIPYTFIDDFDWCKITKKSTTFPSDCFYRISGCLFTNDNFKVSTNKLTFMDLDSKLRERSTSFHRIILGVEQKGNIHRHFLDWIRECHEKYDKQIKFFKFTSSVMRNDPGSRRTQSPWTVYKAIEWDGKVFSKGQLIRTQRTNPIICGTIRRFLLYGDFDGDVYAVGGEMEIIQEPQSLYGDIRSFPLSKLDRNFPSDSVLEIVQEEESKLPASIDLTWPEGEEICEGQTSQAGIAVGAMSVLILNQNDEPIQRLPSSVGSRKLIVEQKLIFTPSHGDDRKPIEIASHVTAHGKTWPYWFKRIDNIVGVGSYVISLQAAFTESGAYTYADGRKLPSLVINFKIKEAPPYRFMVGILESPLRVGEPFNIPLDMQDRYGHPTSASTEELPILESKGLHLKYGGIASDVNSLIIKDVVALGIVQSQQGKNFQMTVTLPGMEKSSQTLKIRLLPGKPYGLKLTHFSDGFVKVKRNEDDPLWSNELECENGSDVSIGVEVVDLAGNTTLRNNLTVLCKFSGPSTLPTLSCNCSQSGCGTISGKLKIKRSSKPQFVKAKLEVPGSKHMKTTEFKIRILPSTKIRSLEVFHMDASSSDQQPVKLKKDQTLYHGAGELLCNLTYQLIDEAKRIVKTDVKLASHIKVNWTNDISTTDLVNNQLPDILVPTNVTDAKFCQVSFASEKKVEFSFHVKPTPGDPSGLKVTVHGERVIRLGVMRQEPVCVKLLDNYGNHLEIKPDQVDMIKLECKGLDETLLTKTIEDDQVFINNIQINEGPLGSKELVVRYGDDMKEFVVIELVAGSPVTLQITGWPQEGKKVTVLSGMKLQEQISVQLLDGWGYPSPESGVKVLLGKDPNIKLTPTPQVLKTNASGTAKFGNFAISGKSGEYYIQPRVVFNRTTIEGKKLFFNLLPNTETPVSVVCKCLADSTTVKVNENWPEFLVEVMSEEGANVTSTCHLCMTIWKGKSVKEKSIPNHAEWHRTVTSNGKFIFQGIKSPTFSADFTAMFGIVSSPTARSFTLCSPPVQLKAESGPPTQICPKSEPGTPTVSNARFNRTLIRSLKLVLKDEFGNLAGADLEGRLVVTIQPCDQTLKSSEVPLFEGCCSRLTVHLKNGELLLQNLILQENSPGIDGSQYILHCELITTPPINVTPFMLKFLFYNDARKHAQMSALARERDELLHVIKTYKETFTAHESLLQEIKKGYADSVKKQQQMLKEIRKQSMHVNEQTTSSEVEGLLQLCTTERDAVLQEPRRQCALSEYPDNSKDVLGKICRLALVKDPDIACVLSWHMSGDMDCLVTLTTKKAREVHRLTGGCQQILPIDSIFTKNLPDWQRPLPHVRAGIKSKNVRGNPVFARDMLQFVKDEDKCKIVFGMLLGDTLILDDLDSANDYRKMVVKFVYCPTILTRQGDRIRSNGKFGGNQNRAPSMDKLKGVVFGAPIPDAYGKCCKQIEMLNDYLAILTEVEAAEEELDAMKETMDTDEMKKKEDEMKETQERLKEIETKIGLSKQSQHSNQDEGEEPKKKRIKR